MDFTGETRRRERSSVLWFTTLVGGTALAGCAATPEDHRVAGEVTLPAYAPEVAPDPSVPVLEFANPLDDPSLSGLDRSHWNEHPYRVSYGDTVHYPTYTGLRMDKGRQESEYPPFPDATNADEVRRPSAATVIGEGLREPLIAVGEAALMIPRAVMHSPGEPMRNNIELERSPGSRPQHPAPTQFTATTGMDVRRETAAPSGAPNMPPAMEPGATPVDVPVPLPKNTEVPVPPVTAPKKVLPPDKLPPGLYPVKKSDETKKEGE